MSIMVSIIGAHKLVYLGWIRIVKFEHYVNIFDIININILVISTWQVYEERIINKYFRTMCMSYRNDFC